MKETSTSFLEKLPGLNCGLCGMKSCAELAESLEAQPSLIQRCILLSSSTFSQERTSASGTKEQHTNFGACGGCSSAVAVAEVPQVRDLPTWRDTLDREIDFYLEHFPEDPGPREIIIPHNPMITRELDVQVGDILLGRPLGMSCGCPITHCGVVMEVDARTGVIVWCVTGPLRTRQEGYKDLGYYIAEGYEGLVNLSRVDIKIGMRYYFQPRMCMLQWRHSGLVNYINRSDEGLQIRLEGLWIG